MKSIFQFISKTNKLEDAKVFFHTFIGILIQQLKDTYLRGEVWLEFQESLVGSVGTYVRQRANLGDQSSNLPLVTQDELWVGSTVERNDV